MPTGSRDVLVLRLSCYAVCLLRVSMPVHPHFGDLAVLRLTEDSAPCVHPLSGAAPAVGAAELGGEPGARRVNLSGLERHFGLRSEERRVGKEGRSRWSPDH